MLKNSFISVFIQHGCFILTYLRVVCAKACKARTSSIIRTILCFVGDEELWIWMAAACLADGQRAFIWQSSVSACSFRESWEGVLLASAGACSPKVLLGPSPFQKRSSCGSMPLFFPSVASQEFVSILLGCRSCWGYSCLHHLLGWSTAIHAWSKHSQASRAFSWCVESRGTHAEWL